jgi:inner membrane protein
MDSITHITLGACLGEAILGKKLGKRALLWGAIAQSLPDIDTVTALFLTPDEALLAHRGITHSFVFAVVVGILLAFLAKNIHRNVFVPFCILVFFFCMQLCVHDLLDTCNAYGTGLLEPFSHQRFSINLLYVADPLFTIGLLTTSVFLIFKRSIYKNASKWAYRALTLSGLYLCFAGVNKLYINHKIQESLPRNGASDHSYISTPAPFNCMLWYVIAKTDSGYNAAYLSTWDKTTQNVTYEYYPENKFLLNQIGNKLAVNNLITFADNYYTVTKTANNININVLRFQQVQGWAKPHALFAFSYPLTAAENQATLLQKGRLSGWNSASLKAYVSRIFGRQTVAYQSK